MATIDMTICEVINVRIDKEMEADESVFFLGEEVDSFNYGFGLTRLIVPSLKRRLS